MTDRPAATVIGTNLVIDYGSEEAARAALDSWPSVEPLDVERLMFAIHRSGVAGCPEDCTSALDEYPSGADSDYATFLAREYAAALPTQASDSPEKTT